VAVCWNTVWSGGGLVARFQELPAMGVLSRGCWLVTVEAPIFHTLPYSTMQLLIKNYHCNECKEEEAAAREEVTFCLFSVREIFIFFMEKSGNFRVRNYAFLVTNGTKNFALATRISQLVTSRQLTTLFHATIIT